MTSGSDESGFEELVRLSKETAKQAQNLANMEQQREEQRQTSQNVLQGLKEISISVAIEQLKSVASNEIIEEISSLINKPDTRDLRKLISDLVHDLEKQTGSISTSNIDMVPIKDSVKTVSILVELLFTLSN